MLPVRGQPVQTVLVQKARLIWSIPLPVAFLLAVCCSGAAQSETLADAIAEAYRSNPTLAGQRALQQVVDETYASALTVRRNFRLVRSHEPIQPRLRPSLLPRALF